jgi:hypothetical protein
VSGFFGCGTTSSRPKREVTAYTQSSSVELLGSAPASIKSLHLFKEQTIVYHVLVVGGQLGQGAVVGYEAQTARDTATW